MSTIFLEDTHTVALIAISLASVVFLYLRSETWKLRHIPTIGYNSSIFSYISVVKSFSEGMRMIHNGYESRYKGAMYKIPMLQSWLVIVSGENILAELKTVPENTLSAWIALDEIGNMSYIAGPELTTNPYHISVIRTQLVRNLANLIPELRDEMLATFTDMIPDSEDWIKLHGAETFTKVIARLTNRVVVGLPLCRNDQFLENTIGYIEDYFIAGMVVGLFPPFLRRLSVSLFRSLSRRRNIVFNLLVPVIEKIKNRNADAEIPTILDLLVAEADETEQDNMRLTKRVMITNLVSIHTTSLAFVQTLYSLAAYPSYINPLRDEIDEVTSKHGWDKAALDKLVKLDSFIREVERMHPPAGFSSLRKAMVDYTFSDGTFIPKGTMLAVAADPVQRDDAVYQDAKTFDGFRFSRINEASSEGRKINIGTLSNDFLPFGIGKHACPGRFFAANELKLLVSHIVANYDIKFENEGVRPDDLLLGPTRLPNPKAEILIRKRV